MKRRYLSVCAAALFIAAFFCGCASAPSSGTTTASVMPTAPQAAMSAPAPSPMAPPPAAEGMYDKAGMAYDAAYENISDYRLSGEKASDGAGAMPSRESIEEEGRKIIRTAGMTMETLAFDDTLAALYKMIDEAGGYIQNSTVDGNTRGWQNRSRTASFVIRLPSLRLDEFLSGAGEIGNVLETSTYDEEITDQYFDTEARLKTLKVQQERLLAILEKSETLTDIIELERALSSVLYEIETLTGTLRKYDKLIAYSTLNLQVREVYEQTVVNPMPKSMSERISQEFQSNIRHLRITAEDFTVWLVGGLPVLLPQILLLLVLAAVILKLRAKRKAAKAKKKESEPPSGADDN